MNTVQVAKKIIEQVDNDPTELDTDEIRVVAAELLAVNDIFRDILAAPDIMSNLRRVQEWRQKNASEESNG